MHSVSSQADGDRVFRKPLLLQPRRATSITLAAITLHNWLRSETETGQIQHLQDLTEDNGTHTKDNSWLNLEDFGHHNATQEAKGIRKEFTEYVMKEGHSTLAVEECSHFLMILFTNTQNAKT